MKDKGSITDAYKWVTTPYSTNQKWVEHRDAVRNKMNFPYSDNFIDEYMVKPNMNKPEYKYNFSAGYRAWWKHANKPRHLEPRYYPSPKHYKNNCACVYCRRYTLQEKIKQEGQMATATVTPAVKKLTTAQRAKLITVIKNATKEWIVMFPKVEELDEAGKKHAAIQDLFHTQTFESGASRIVFAKILSVLLDKEIIPRPGGSGKALSGNIVVLACAVPIKPTIGSHNYPLNEPFVFLSDGIGGHMRMTGRIGNSLDDDLQSLRPATNDEIDNLADRHLNAIATKIIFI